MSSFLEKTELVGVLSLLVFVRAITLLNVGSDCFYPLGFGLGLKFNRIPLYYISSRALYYTIEFS